MSPKYLPIALWFITAPLALSQDAASAAPLSEAQIKEQDALRAELKSLESKLPQMSPDDQKFYWARMNDIRLALMSDSDRSELKKKLASMSDEERKAYEANREFEQKLAFMSSEERSKYEAEILERKLASMSDEERKAYEANREWEQKLASMSSEERAKYEAEILERKLASMSDEERKAYETNRELQYKLASMTEEERQKYQAANAGPAVAEPAVAEAAVEPPDSSAQNLPDKPQSVESPVQSPARPFDLDIAAPVQLAASDAASAEFQKNVLPGMLELANKRLADPSILNGTSAVSLDPANLVLGYDANVRAYFLGEGAGFANTLGISTTGGGPFGKDAALIFPNASSSEGLDGSGSMIRSSKEPLLAGDFVDLGTLKAGTLLDFFLIANGANGGTDFFSTNLSLNKDGIVHAVSFAENGSAYLVLGFEDLMGGGDRDFNDVFFAVEIGTANVKHLAGLGAPEPSMAIGALLSVLSLAGLRRRRA